MAEIKHEIKKQKPEKTKIAEKEISIENREALESNEKLDLKQKTDKKTSEKKPAYTKKPQSIQKQATNIKGLQRQRQIKILGDLALERGVNYAVSIAQKLDNAYVLDEFHDSLVDDLYEELKKRGKLKEL